MRPFGRMLWEENARALVMRYGDRAEGDRLVRAAEPPPSRRAAQAWRRRFPHRKLRDRAQGSESAAINRLVSVATLRRLDTNNTRRRMSLETPPVSPKRLRQLGSSGL